jgi:hypothetical protein
MGRKKIPLGIFYQVERPSYEDQIPQIKEKALVETPKKDLSELLKKICPKSSKNTPCFFS